MTTPNENYISVDDAMLRFENHLLSHDRVILSAKFGEMQGGRKLTFRVYHALSCQLSGAGEQGHLRAY